MFNIETLNKIDSKGLDIFPKEKYTISDECSSADGIILRSFKMHDTKLSSSVKAIARAGAGVNNIPVERYTEEGVVVFNTPGANANAVKELVMAGLLMASRDIIGGVNWVQTLSKDDNVATAVEKGKSNFGGIEIKGKTIAIVGLGAIGVMVANTARSLGMKVIGYDPYISINSAWDLNQSIVRAESIDAMLAEADYISLNMPLMDSTKGFMNSEKFDLVKPGVRVLNFARGGLVDNADMIKAIEEGKVACYVTDFPDADMLNVKGVIPIPHLGASTEESETNCAVMAVEQMRDYLENGNIRNSVNFPEAIMDRNSGNRILIANKNVPNMVAQISTLLAEESVNISNMLNKNKNGIAYNIIDIDRDDLNEDIASKIKSIEGVLMCHILAPVK